MRKIITNLENSYTLAVEQSTKPNHNTRSKSRLRVDLENKNSTREKDKINSESKERI